MRDKMGVRAAHAARPAPTDAVVAAAIEGRLKTAREVCRQFIGLTNYDPHFVNRGAHIINDMLGELAVLVGVDFGATEEAP